MSDTTTNGQNGKQLAGTYPVRLFRGAGYLLLLVSALALGLKGCQRRPPAHGTAFLVSLDTNHLASAQDQAEELRRAGAVLGKRLKRFGVPYFIEPQAQGRLLVKVARLDVDDLAAVRNMISRQGLLEFRMVHGDSEALIRAGTRPAGYELLKQTRTLANTNISVPLLVKREPERGLTGKYLEDATALNDPDTGAPEVTFRFNAAGARLFEQITTEYQPKGREGHRLAIVLDGALRSAPVIVEVIASGRGVISGDFTAREAVELANILARPLDVPVRVLEEKTF